MIIFNEETKDIIEEKHICYYTKDQSLKIELYEVFEKKIKHPTAKEHAFVHKFDTRLIETFYRTELDSAASVLLEAAQNNIRKNKKKIIRDYFKVEKLKENFLYKIDARNATRYGIWILKDKTFLISRIKFNFNYLFEELHYDINEQFGTAKPLKEIELSPFDFKLNQKKMIKLEDSYGEYYGYQNEKEILEYLNKFEGKYDK